MIQTDVDKIDWKGLEGEVVFKLRILREMLRATPMPLRLKMLEDLALPNIRLLAEFCSNIKEDR